MMQQFRVIAGYLCLEYGREYYDWYFGFWQPLRHVDDAWNPCVEV